MASRAFQQRTARITGKADGWGLLRTIRPMADARNVALEVALAPFAHVPVLGDGVRHVLGAQPGPLDAPDAPPVTGFYLEPTEEIFSVWLVTPHHLSRFELATNGATFSVTVPASRIRRVVEQATDEALSVVVEIDAYQLKTLTRGEVMSTEGATIGDGAPEVAQRTGTLITESTTSASEFIVTTTDSARRSDLADLAVALRATLS